jgi:hypothetical protein
MDHSTRRVGMPQRAWSAKRERQYEHVKEGYEERGTPEDRAEEIAARTVKQRAGPIGRIRDREPFVRA